MKINYLLISVLVFACSPKPSISEDNLSIFQQLESDHLSGQLSKDEYYTLLTYSIFAQELLPKKYNGHFGQHDATPILRKVQRAFPTLSIKTQNHLKQWIKPLPPKPSKLGVNR